MKIIHESKISNFHYPIYCQTSHCHKSLHFQKKTKNLNGLESKFCQRYFVNYAQVQLRSYLWLKLSFNKYSQEI